MKVASAIRKNVKNLLNPALRNLTLKEMLKLQSATRSSVRVDDLPMVSALLAIKDKEARAQIKELIKHYGTSYVNGQITNEIPKIIQAKIKVLMDAETERFQPGRGLKLLRSYLAQAYDQQEKSRNQER